MRYRLEINSSSKVTKWVSRARGNISTASLLLCFQNLLLERVRLREVNADLVGGDLVVDLGHGIDLVLNLLSIEGI